LTVDQDAALAQRLNRLAVVGQPVGKQLVVRIRRVEQRQRALRQQVDRAMHVVSLRRDVLDALAAEGLEVLLDLAVVVRALVDPDAYLSAGARGARVANSMNSNPSVCIGLAGPDVIIAVDCRKTLNSTEPPEV
jgi:hypothetical protein